MDYAAYYWANPDTGFVMKWPVYCNGPSVESDYLSVYYEPAKEDKLTAEVRIQGGGETIEWLVGLYYEDSTDWWLDPFGTPTPGGRVNDAIGASQYSNSIARQFWEWYHGEEFPNATSSWSAGQNIDWEQKAIFGEFTWHINDSWDLTVGGRYFDRSNDMRYWLNRPGRLYYDEGAYDYELDDREAEYREANGGAPMPRIGEETQFVPKVSLAYHFGKANDKMVYALYSEGVRQGGVNRLRGEPFFPQQYDSDLMKNHELGYKSSFAEGKGRLNLTYYHMAWEDYQLQLQEPSNQDCIDPETGEVDEDLKIPHVCGQPWQTVIANLGDATIDGFNVSLDYSPNENWVLGFNYEKMEAETDSDHDLDGDGELNIRKGMRLPLVPDYKAAGWVEHHRPVNWGGAHDFFIRLQWSFTGDSVSRLEPLGLDTPNPQFLNPTYNIGDLRVGLVGDDWQVDLFLNNLTDERAIYTYGGAPGTWWAGQLAEGRLHHQSAFVARPREFGVRFTKSW
jgi:outer membrane receptor protein involved in Fe transport